MSLNFILCTKFITNEYIPKDTNVIFCSIINRIKLRTDCLKK